MCWKFLPENCFIKAALTWWSGQTFKSCYSASLKVLQKSWNHLCFSDSDRFCTLWMMWKNRHVHWRALLAGEEGCWPSPYGCLKLLQKVARQKAFSLKEGLSAPKRSKPLGFLIYWLSEPEWGGKSQIPTSDNLINTNWFCQCLCLIVSQKLISNEKLLVCQQ